MPSAILFSLFPTTFGLQLNEANNSQTTGGVLLKRKITLFAIVFQELSGLIHLMAPDGPLLHPTDGSITILALHCEFF